MDADPQLEERLAQLEAELSQARHSLAQKDFELDRLRGQVEEATLAADGAQRETEATTKKYLVSGNPTDPLNGLRGVCHLL